MNLEINFKRETHECDCCGFFNTEDAEIIVRDPNTYEIIEEHKQFRDDTSKDSGDLLPISHVDYGEAVIYQSHVYIKGNRNKLGAEMGDIAFHDDLSEMHMLFNPKLGSIRWIYEDQIVRVVCGELNYRYTESYEDVFDRLM
jgi:hypothetical protein